MKKAFLALAAVAILGVSCKKEETNEGGGGNPGGTPSEMIVGHWMGDVQTLTIDVSGTGGVADTNFTTSDPITYLNLHFMADGTGSIDSAGFDSDPLTWVIENNNLLVLDGSDTLMINKLNSTNLDLGQSFVDDSQAPAIITYDSEIKFVK